MRLLTPGPLTLIKSGLLTFVIVAATTAASAAPITNLPMPIPAAGNTQLTPLQNKLRDAYTAISKTRWADATQHLQEASKLDPKSPLPLLGLAEVARLQGDQAGVQRQLTAAQTLAPNDVSVLTATGRFAYSQGQYEQAVALLTKAAANSPKAVEPRIDIGDIYLRPLKKPQQAIAWYQQALQISPDHPGANYALGTALSESGDFIGATKALEKAVRADSRNPLPWQMLARNSVLQKKYDDALSAYSKVLEISPHNLDAALARVELLVITGDKEAAARDLKNAVAAKSENPNIWLRIGGAHESLHQFDDALNAYQKASALAPQSPVVWNNMAWLAATQNKKSDEAIGWARKAVSLDAKSPIFQDTLGWVLYLKNDKTAALTELRAATQKQPPYADAFYHLGVVLAETGDKSGATTALQKALQLDSTAVFAADAKTRLNKLKS